MKLAWASDLHLEMAGSAAVEAFCEAIDEAAPDAVLLGGDLATAPGLARWLRALRARIERPLYVVLGNHDYYHGAIAEVRATVAAVAAEDPGICWLGGVGARPLTASTVLVGVGGWGDARLGNPATGVVLNDFLLIADLAGRPAFVRNAKLGELGDEAAEHLRRGLAEAVALSPSEVVVLMHVPPFREACWHEGQLSNDDWLPFFACKAAGDALLEAAVAHAAVRFTVLCGHTHSAGEATLAPNLRVSTAAARYGRPRVARVWTVG